MAMPVGMAVLVVIAITVLGLQNRAGRIEPADGEYADFDTQIRAVLGDESEARFSDAARFLERLFLDGLRPR